MNAVITGATKGIGKATALLLAEKGFHLCICARNGNELAATKDELLKLNPGIAVYEKTCDVSDKQQVIEFGHFCIDSMGTIDLLFNNAGIFLPGNLHDEPDGLLEQLIHTNLYSAYHLTRTLLPSMMQRRSGHIFNMCSVASINAYDKGGSYAISKFGLLGFTKNLRHELMEYNISVTALIAGAVLTPSWEGIDLPDERFIKAEDVARLLYQAFEISKGGVVEEILIRPMLGDL